MASTDIRPLLDSQSEAIRNKDIDRLMSFYSPDIIYFDVVPPLQFAGSAALRARFLDWFDRFEGPIRQEIGDINVTASGDAATVYMLIRAGGTLKDGRATDYWVRATTCWQRSDREWLITHEHISLPIDMKSGRAVMDLVP